MIDLILPTMIVLIVTILFLRVSIRMRKKGGSLTSVVLGSTHALHGQDRRKALEIILEKNAGQKVEEQDSESQDDDQASSPGSSRNLSDP